MLEVYLTMYEWVERAKGKGCKEHIYALSELADAYYELELDEDAMFQAMLREIEG